MFLRTEKDLSHATLNKTKALYFIKLYSDLTLTNKTLILTCVDGMVRIYL